MYARKKILDISYRRLLQEYLTCPEDVYVYENISIKMAKVILTMMNHEVLGFYDLELDIYHKVIMTDCLEMAEITELSELFNIMKEHYASYDDFYKRCAELIIRAAETSYEEADANDYITSSDIQNAVENNQHPWLREFGYDVDIDGASDELRDVVIGRIFDYIDDVVSGLPYEISSRIDSRNDITVGVAGTRKIIAAHVGNSDYDEPEYRTGNPASVFEEIDAMFER